jgi:hypothetical protein
MDERAKSAVQLAASSPAGKLARVTHPQPFSAMSSQARLIREGLEAPCFAV